MYIGQMHLIPAPESASGSFFHFVSDSSFAACSFQLLTDYIILYVLMYFRSSAPDKKYCSRISAQAWLSLSAL